MIGVDTNLLVRLFIDDDADQHKRAVAFFSSQPPDMPIHVNVIVLIEMVWLLTRRFGYARDEVLDLLVSIISNAGFAVEREDLIMAAIEDARAYDAGFADALISGLNRDAGCETTMTFDRLAATRVPGMELLA